MFLHIICFACCGVLWTARLCGRNTLLRQGLAPVIVFQTTPAYIFEEHGLPPIPPPCALTTGNNRLQRYCPHSPCDCFAYVPIVASHTYRPTHKPPTRRKPPSLLFGFRTPSSWPPVPRGRHAHGARADCDMLAVRAHSSTLCASAAADGAASSFIPAAFRSAARSRGPVPPGPRAARPLLLALARGRTLRLRLGDIPGSHHLQVSAHGLDDVPSQIHRPLR